MDINNVNNGKTTEKLINFFDLSVKSLIAEPDVQAALKKHIFVDKRLIVKKVNKPSTEYHTQKIEGIIGSTLEDATAIKFTIFDEKDTYFLDPVESINKKYQIIDYNLGLEANMSGKDFKGYSATSLKLIVTKIEEVKGGK